MSFWDYLFNKSITKKPQSQPAQPMPIGEECRRLDEIDALKKGSQEWNLAWEAYWEHFKTLPPQLQYPTAWELGKRGCSAGTSGFHGGVAKLSPFPFSACGWADYENPGWGADQGVAFRVCMPCFGDRKPLLYYLDDDNWPREDHEQERLALIKRYSSGISHVRVERRVCKDWHGNVGEHRVVLFEPDPAAIKKTVMLEGKAVPTSELGGYIFMLPRAGEFYCLLGEVLNGKMIPLHEDDFCMK